MTTLQEEKLQNVLLETFLYKNSDILFKWFTENYPRANPEKYNILLKI